MLVVARVRERVSRPFPRPTEVRRDVHGPHRMTAPAERFVSAGRLPATGTTRARVEEAHALYRGVDDGSLSGVYPALATVDPCLFGLSVVSTAG